MSSSPMPTSLQVLRGLLTEQRRREESDEQLLHAFLARGEESAFDVLVRRHGPMVLSVCRRVLGHLHDAEDAFQATFLLLARKAAVLRKKASLASFLHGAAYRTALKARQSATRRRKYEKQTPPRQVADPAGELLWREVRTLLDEEIARLPEKYQSVFVLCCLEGRSRAEAARRLGLKEGTVSSRLTAARQRLRQRLARRGVELTSLLAAVAVMTPPSSALPAVSLARLTSDALPPAITALARSGFCLGKAKLAALLMLAASVMAGAWQYQRDRIQLHAAPPPAARKEPPAAATAKTELPPTITIRGRVLGPDGKPMPGARLYSARVQKISPRDDPIIVPMEPADAEGRFRLRLRQPDSEENAYLVAHADGFGVDWINLGDDELSTEVTLRLVKDVPITGRVVNTEGRPLAGVSVSIAAIVVPANERLDDYLKGWHTSSFQILDTLNSPRKRLHVSLDGIMGSTITDRDGRFTLRGAGGERIVHVSFFGSGVARTTPYVLTRPGLDMERYTALLQKDEDCRRFVTWNRFRIYPPNFTFVAEAGRTFAGTIRDKVTGKPLAGCRVIASTSYGYGITAVSDAVGKYRLEGLAKSPPGSHVWVRPPRKSSYLFGGGRRVADPVGLAKVDLDFELVKGAIVTGRVVDKRTGKGVRCSFRSLPLPENKLVGFNLDNTDLFRLIETAADGAFRLVTVPGPALLAARVSESERFHGQRLCAYRPAVPDPDHRDIFKADGDSWRVALAGNRLETIHLENAVKVINVKESGETRVELSVESGAMARIAVQDPEGKPLAGAWAAGLTAIWPITYQLPEATATVYALNSDKPRTLAFFHAARKLGGTATVRGDGREPVLIKLTPVGAVSGRLIDGEGNPLEGVEVSIIAQTKIGAELYRFAAPTGKPARTGKDGRFFLEGVIPNLEFRFNLRQGRTFFTSEPRIGSRQIKAGESLNLGDVRIKRDR